MKRLLLLAILGLSSIVQAQNLVPNPSFEDTVMFSNGQPGVKGWQNNIGSPDYFSPFFLAPFEGFKAPSNSRGTQVAYDGVAYFGFAVFDKRDINAREYLQVQLLDSLQQGEEYEVEFYLSLADTFRHFIKYSDIGIAFNEKFNQNNLDHKVREFRPFYPSDSIWDASNKTTWQKFHYTHTADGNEKVLIIGCFLNDNDISSDTVQISGTSSFALNTSIYYIDQISVQLKDTSTSLVEQGLKTQVQVFPNPTHDVVQLDFQDKQQVQFNWYNIRGQMLHIPTVCSSEKKYHFSLKQLEPGIYFLQFSNGTESRSIKVVKQ